MLFKGLICKAMRVIACVSLVFSSSYANVILRLNGGCVSAYFFHVSNVDHPSTEAYKEIRYTPGCFLYIDSARTIPQSFHAFSRSNGSYETIGQHRHCSIFISSSKGHIWELIEDKSCRWSRLVELQGVSLDICRVSTHSSLCSTSHLFSRFFLRRNCLTPISS